MGLRLLTKRKLLLLNKGRLQAVLRGDGASFKFLSLKARVDAALTLRLCVELRVTGGKFGMRRRICVIISPATLTTLVGHLRGEEEKKSETGNLNNWAIALSPRDPVAEGA